MLFGAREKLISPVGETIGKKTDPFPRARYAATHYEDNYDDDVMVSIVDDLLEMADDPEGFAEA